jgi:hypothetical protein
MKYQVGDSLIDHKKIMELETSAEHNTSSFEWHHIEATETCSTNLSTSPAAPVSFAETSSMLQYRVPSNATLEMLLKLMKKDNTVHEQ